MGYRAQNNYDAADREAWRKLPWRERFDWRLVAVALIVLAAFAAGLLVRLYVATPVPVPTCSAASSTPRPPC